MRNFYPTVRSGWPSPPFSLSMSKMSFLSTPRLSDDGSTVVRVFLFCGVVMAVVVLLISQEDVARSLGIPVRFAGFHKPAPGRVPPSIPELTPASIPVANTEEPSERRRDKASAIAARRKKKGIIHSAHSASTSGLTAKASSGSPAKATPTPVAKAASVPPVKPIPVPPARATPAPQAKATPVPKPAPTPVSAPTPVPQLALDTISRTPAWWPKQVTLTKATAFPILMAGQDVGQVQVPAGRLLRLCRVADGKVEVEFQAGRHIISADSTDVVMRATALSLVPVPPDATPPPTAQAPSAAPSAAAESSPTPSATASPSASPTPARSHSRFAESVQLDVIRSRKMGNPNSYQAKEEIAFKVKLSNNDLRNAFEGMKGEIYAFTAGISDRSQLKLIGSQSFDFSLAVRGHFELTTDAVTIVNERTGYEAAHSFKYEGWFLRIRDGAGEVVTERASPPSLLKLSDKIEKLTVDTPFDRTTGK